jgi:hypothetical protein
MGLTPNAGANAEPTAKSAIDPEILIPEISLLLEFVSGRPTTSLSGGSQVLLPKGKDYDTTLNEYFRIREIHAQRGTLSGADIKFLLEFRDYLNSRSYPAMGSTISFTTLVIGEGHKEKAAVLDAQKAYPEYRIPARLLSRALARGQCVAVAATIIVAVVAAYVYWGNLIVSNIAQIAEKKDAAERIITSQELTGATKGADGLYVRFCEDGKNDKSTSGTTKMIAFHSTEQYHICDKMSDLAGKMERDYEDLNYWWKVATIGRAPEKGVPDQTAAALLAVLNGYLIPLLMGFLGSTAYVLRLYLSSMRDRLLNPYFLRSARVRVALGTLSGLAIGFFLSPGGNAAKSPAELAAVVTLSTPALAFLAGYAVEVLFKFIDLLAEQVFQAKPS